MRRNFHSTQRIHVEHTSRISLSKVQDCWTSAQNFQGPPRMSNTTRTKFVKARTHFFEGGGAGPGPLGLFLYLYPTHDVFSLERFLSGVGAKSRAGNPHSQGNTPNFLRFCSPAGNLSLFVRVLNIVSTLYEYNSSVCTLGLSKSLRLHIADCMYHTRVQGSFI